MMLRILLLLLGCLPALAQAQPADCSAEGDVVYTTGLGRQHHPIGKPLPRTAQFNQPLPCGDNWFFDLNRNGLADPGEPKLFGPMRVVVCSSCHADSPDAKTDTARGVSLRLDPAVLCLVCHRI